MTSVTPFSATDLLKLNPINLDALTENYSLNYYLSYLVTWPSLLFKIETAGLLNEKEPSALGYMIGKSEGTGPEWHSHITAVTVDHRFRRLGLGRLLVDQLAIASNAPDQNCYFMDLFVRRTNKIAIDMYKNMGFSVFRKLLNYYGSGKNEDAFDMRLPLTRDRDRLSLQKSSWTHESNMFKYIYDKRALV